MSDPDESTTKKAGKRALQAILADLSDPIQDRHLQDKRKGGQTLTFCPWYLTKKYLDHHTNGFWSKSVEGMMTEGNRIFVRVCVTIHAAEGEFTRCATGTEQLMKYDEKKDEWKEVPYGDPSSNAESMAFRRACANFGLGAHLYEGK